MLHRAIIVSGGDAAYFPLIEELHRSIVAATGGNPPAFAVIDAGLLPEQADALREAGAMVMSPPDFPDLRRGVLQKRPALAANLAKLWLDRMFAGYSTIIWMDGDTWVQDFAAVELMYGAAQTGALAIVPGSGRYWDRLVDVRWLLGGLGGLCQMRSFLFKNGRLAGLPLSVLRNIGTRALLNAGVFALRHDAPHWRAMQAWQTTVLRGGGKPFTSDQVAIALAVYVNEMPVQLLPDTCNYIRPWRVDLSIPALVEHYYPYPKVGIVHLAAQKTMRFDPDATVEVTDLAGRKRALNLRSGHFQRMAAELAAGPGMNTSIGLTRQRSSVIAGEGPP